MYAAAALAGLLAPPYAYPESPPRFSFAVVTDVQYADRETRGARAYRESLRKLEAAAAAIDAARPAFTIQLGDAIDEGGMETLDRVLRVFDGIGGPKYHVLGNHDLSVPRESLLRRLKLERAWYDFASHGWRFVVLDGMDVSAATPEGEGMLAALRAAGRRNAVPWNGAIGEAQKTWLRGVLQTAADRGAPVILFCHFPVLEDASTAAHLLWNHEEIVRILETAGPAVAWLNGHDHRGGYAERNGIHHVTLPGMVESGEANSWTLVRVYEDRLELRGTGTAPSRTLEVRARVRR